MKSMSKVVDRVTKLIALSSSNNIEEARTSAHLACRLIREHGIQIGAPAGAAPKASSVHTPPPPPSSSRSREDKKSYVTVRDIPDGLYDFRVLYARHFVDFDHGDLVKLLLLIEQAHHIEGRSFEDKCVTEFLGIAEARRFHMKNFAVAAGVGLPESARSLPSWAQSCVGVRVRASARHRDGRHRTFLNLKYQPLTP